MIRTTIRTILDNRSAFDGFVATMRSGGVAALPTDTLYGLAADADSIAGVKAVYRIKGREEAKPLILFLDRIDRLREIGINPSVQALEILSKHWPGALTAVFSPTGRPLAAFSHPSLGIRIPAHDDLRALLAAYPGQLLTTSANRSGQNPLCDGDAIEREMGAELDFLFDDGTLESSEASTVIGLDTWPPRVFRAGKIRL
ncbi:MAG: L-threonylcarbamoyladenylate synthase [Candidatus Ozemobacteraceae bacterium]